MALEMDVWALPDIVPHSNRLAGPLGIILPVTVDLFCNVATNHMVPATHISMSAIRSIAILAIHVRKTVKAEPSVHEQENIIQDRP